MKRITISIIILIFLSLPCAQSNTSLPKKIFVHISCSNKDLKRELNEQIHKHFPDYSFRYGQKMYKTLQKYEFLQNKKNKDTISQKLLEANFEFIILVKCEQLNLEEYNLVCHTIPLAKNNETIKFKTEKQNFKNIVMTFANYLQISHKNPSNSYSFLYIIFTIIAIVTAFSYTLFLLIKNGTVWMWGALLQILLFHILFMEIFYLVGKEHFENVPSDGAWYKWILFTLLHVLRALDVADFMEEFKFGIHFIKHSSNISGTAIVAMHMMVDVFFIAIVVKFINQRLTKITNTLDILKKKLKNQLYFLSISVLVIFSFSYIMLVVVEKWSFWDAVFLWPVDNILRIIDIGDFFQIFHWKLHNVYQDIAHGVLAIIFRFIVGIYVARWLKKIRIVSLQGAGLTLEELIANLDNKDLTILKATIAKFTKIGEKVQRRVITKFVDIVNRYQVNFPIENKLSKEYCFFIEDFYSTEKTDLCDLLVQATYNIDPEAKELIQYLQNEEKRQSASKLLSAIGEKAIPSLMRALLDNNTYVRRKAFESLNNMTSPPGKWCQTQVYLNELPIIIQALHSHIAEIRKIALLIIKASKITSSIAGNVIPIVKEQHEKEENQEIKKLCQEVLDNYKGICFDQEGKFICH